MSSDLMAMYWQTPPIARSIATAIFVVSVGIHTGMISYVWFYYQHALLFQIPPQIWRLATTWLLSGGNISIILDPYFVYMYLSQMETSSPRFTKKEDVVWYLMFVGTLIIIFDALIGLNSPFMLQALILALAYTGNQDARGQKTNFFFITIPSQLVPVAMLFATFIMGGGPMAVLHQLCGLLAAHLYDFLTRLWPEFGGGSNLIPTPGWLSRLVSSTERVQERAYGTAIRGAGSGSGSGAAAGAGNGPLPDAWRTRGKGQRLG